MTNRKPGNRAGLSTERVVAAAVSEVEERGLEGLSMRAVARRLGVAPNALYSHVANRDALIDAIIDSILGHIQPGSSEMEEIGPLEAIRSMMIDTYDVLINHAALVPAYLARQGSRGPNAVRLGIMLDHWLETLGIPETEIPEARRVLITHAIGHAAFATSGPEDNRPIPSDVARRQYLRGLAWLLDGIRNIAPLP